MLIGGVVSAGWVLAHIIVAEVDALAGVEVAGSKLGANSIRQGFKPAGGGGMRCHNGW